jgi:Domain of unknown function (DUF3291)
MTLHLAQINIGRLIAPVDDPRIAGFVSQLDPVNAIADAAPGFVWRLQGRRPGTPPTLSIAMIRSCW